MSGGRGERAHERWLAVLAALLLAWGSGWDPFASPSFVPAPARDGNLRIVTWNLGESTEAGAPALRDEALPTVIEALRFLAPDLVLLQEIRTRRQAESLASELGDGWSLALPPTGERRVALLARGVLIPFDVPRAAGRALGAHANLRVGSPQGAVEVDVVVVHADAFSSRRRNRLLGSAADALAERARGPHTILGGDFNLEVDPDRRRDLLSDDAYLDLESFHYAARGKIDAGVDAGPTAEPDRRIDYILVGEGGFAVRRSGVWRGRRVGAMDHDPLIVDLEPLRGAAREGRIDGSRGGGG